jgi:hypothetical protein
MTCNSQIPCPKNCTSIDHGICQYNATCKCNSGWQGDDCSEGIIREKQENQEKQEIPEDGSVKSLISIQAEKKKDKDEFKCENDCSGHGTCDIEQKKCICSVIYNNIERL